MIVRAAPLTSSHSKSRPLRKAFQRKAVAPMAAESLRRRSMWVRLYSDSGVLPLPTQPAMKYRYVSSSTAGQTRRPAAGGRDGGGGWHGGGPGGQLGGEGTPCERCEQALAAKDRMSRRLSSRAECIGSSRGDGAELVSRAA
eukprot:2977132-Prymnesium_polylepis.3